VKVNKWMALLFYAGVLLGGSSTTFAGGQVYLGAGGGWSTGAGFSGTHNETCIGRVESYGTSICRDRITHWEASNLNSQSSFAWEIKLGYSPAKNSWLAFEFNYFERNPEIKRQPVSAVGANASQLFPTLPFTGSIEANVGKVRTAAFLVLVRPPEDWLKGFVLSRLEPYAGVGLGVSLLTLGPILVYDNANTLVGTGTRENATDIQLNFVTTLGLNIKVTENILLFGEYKFAPGITHTFDQLDTLGTLETDYIDHLFFLGLTYRFNTDG